MTEITDPVALIAHIVERYHEVHRAQLPELIRMARRVEAVHQAKPGVPAGLADALQALEGELLNHMAKEETVLFPLLQQGEDDLAARPIAMLRREHDDHGEALKEIARLTNDITAPREACNTWRALYAGLAQLQGDLIEHIRLENDVLFAQFDPAARQELGCGSDCECS